QVAAEQYQHQPQPVGEGEQQFGLIRFQQRAGEQQPDQQGIGQHRNQRQPTQHLQLPGTPARQCLLAGSVEQLHLRCTVGIVRLHRLSPCGKNPRLTSGATLDQTVRLKPAMAVPRRRYGRAIGFASHGRTTMSTELLLAFIAFAFVTSVTPGPNNMMLLASGVNLGVRRSIPHMLGISLGFMLLVAAVGLGLGQVFQRLPVLHDVLRSAGAAYLLYLAWKIAGSGAPDAEGNTRGKPFTCPQAAAFQWVNPKAWIMAIGAITTYTPQEGFLVNVLLIAALFALVNCPSVGLWAVAGSLLRRWLGYPRVLRTFNIGMALLLVASLYPILIDVKGGL